MQIVIITELAVQGLDGLPGNAQLTFQPGHNAVVCPALDPGVVASVVRGALFWSAGRPLGGGNVRAAIAFSAAGGLSLRVTRDLQSGAANLLRYDSATRKFVTQSRQAAEVDAKVRELWGVGDGAAFEAAFVLRPEQFPSSRAAAATALSLDEDTGALQQKLHDIEAQLEAAKTIKAVEYELDGLQKRKFELDDILQRLAPDTSEITEARAEVARLEYMAHLPVDFRARYDVYRTYVERRDTDLRRWEAEHEELSRTLRTVQLEPIFKDWRLWLALGVGVLAIAAAALLGGALRYLAFIDIPAFGFATFLLWQHLTHRDMLERAKYKLSLSDERRERLLERNREEIAEVEGLLAQARLESPEDVYASLGQWETAQQRLAQAEARAQQIGSSAELLQARAERQSVEQHIARLEEQLVGLTAVGPDVQALQAEAAALRAQLGKAEGAGGGAAPPGLAELFSAARAVLQADAQETARRLTQRGAELVSQLSRQKVPGLSVDANGAVALRNPQGALVPWDKVSDALRDLAYLALRGALCLETPDARRAPLWVVDLTNRLASQAPISPAFFSTLAKGGQVIMLVSKVSHAPGAAHVVTLGAA